MSSSAMKWTPAQGRAIHTVDRSLLVSAAAGSGKTSVLAERCAHLVCDAPPPYRCDVTELLVVTFTEAAAAEMRSRIAAALHKRYQQSDDARLAHQLALIDRAQISTIHSFCSRVLRQHFHLLALDPNFQMLSEQEGTLLRSEIAREIFAHHYEHNASEAFARLIDRYGDGRDDTLRSRVIRIHGLLGSLVDPDGWIAKSRQRLRDGADKPMSDSALGRALLRRIQSQLKTLSERLVRLMAQLHDSDRLSKYEDYTSEIVAVVEAWKDAFAKQALSGLAAVVRDTKFSTMPTVRDLSSNETAMKNEMTSIRDLLKKDGELHDLCRFSETEWRDGLRATIEPANLMLALVEEFGRRYRAAKDEQRVLDFTDLEQLALKVLRNPDVAREYQRQFKHVLVDEYQDVNELQDTILTLVSREQNDDGQPPNFFCVGDVKQSIYRFRLADPDRFLKRDERFRAMEAGGAVIDLQTNFRSRAPLLNTLNEIFARLMTKEAAELLYSQTHYLHAPADSPYLSCAVDSAHVEVHLLPKSSDVSEEGEESLELDQAEREAAFVANRINELVGTLAVLAKSETGELQPRPLRHGDIAILLRSMKFKAEHFADILRAHGIPVHSDSGGGFFASTEVQDALALLKVLDNQQQDIPLAALLRSPIAAIAHPEDALARIRIAFPYDPFHQAVVRYAREQDDDLAARLRDFFHEIAHWRELAHRRPLAETLWFIYDRSGYLAFVEGLDDGAQRVANLLALHEHARTFGTFRRQGLNRFMRFLDTLRDEIDDLGLPSVASAADDAVRIMSVHRSKGLEFPVVFVPDLGKRHNLSDCRGNILVDREVGIGLSVCDETRRIRYPSLASTIVSERLRKQSLAEEMRVLYVATTRARERLILVGTCASDAQDKWTTQWHGHAGALPADEVLRGNCMLDWLGPALACISGHSTSSSFQVTSHATVATQSLKFARRPELTDRQRAIAELQTMNSIFAPEVVDSIEEIWNRVTRPYEHARLMTMRASTAVSRIAHEPVDTGGETSAPAHPFVGEPERADDLDVQPVDQSLRRPRVGADVLAPSATDVGIATHLLLQHVQFDRPCDLHDLRSQMTDLIEKRILAANVATAIDLAAIEWLVNRTDLGALMRQHAKSILREVPINFPLEADCTAPLDRVMVRGRIDALLPLPGNSSGNSSGKSSGKSPTEVLIIDFKTDWIDGDVQLDPRTAIYQRQLNEYGRAVQFMLGCDTIKTHIVYLRAGQIVISTLAS